MLEININQGLINKIIIPIEELSVVFLEDYGL